MYNRSERPYLNIKSNNEKIQEMNFTTFYLNTRMFLITWLKMAKHYKIFIEIIYLDYL